MWCALRLSRPPDGYVALGSLNTFRTTSPRFWLPRALAVLALIAASCSVPSFQFSDTATEHCSNSISDEGETGIDCGGTCPGCPAGATCSVNNDCLGNQCVDSVCQDASCTDGVRSGSETDQDCGGGACAPCGSGLACVADRDCTSGVCMAGFCAQPSCSDALKNGDESDLNCGGSCPACLPGQKCKLPSDCSGGDCTNGSCSLTCLDGKGNCDGDASNGCETNLKTDTEHCGACETPCSLAHASAACSGGSCVVLNCTAPFADCDGDPSNGCETNTSTDAGNCKGCGLACVGVNGTSTCVASACQISCDANYADCDGDPSNGCEKKVDGDALNCGACGKVCDAGNGTPNCVLGKCGVSDCPAGFGDCDGDPKNGCEVNLTKDAGNCKVCGSKCEVANNTPACVASACTVGTCDATHADCDGKASNGCETNIATDASNCGVCSKVCGVANGTSKCENKLCKVSNCTAPWADCDGNGTDCETNTSSNGSNCGGCGANGLNCNTVYGPLNATGKCVASACQLDKCAANFADCNANPDADGCEANLKTSSGNCGGCGSVCQAPNGSNACTGGTCVPNCGTAFGDCDGNVKTGCEAVLAKDVNNCGGCAIACQQLNATNVCSGSACSPTCSQTYFKSCDGNNNNGCEIDMRSSKANCGACAKACADNFTSTNNCVNSTCSPVCTTNHADCDSNPQNGCETPTATDPVNCGGCNVQCKTQNASGTTCGGGACNPTCSNGWAACSNPAAGCLTSIDTAAHCGNCATSCSGTSPFCVSRVCTHNLNIGVVNADTVGSSTANGASLILPHNLQTSAASNAYRLVVVGVTGFGNGTSSLPLGVKYDNVDMQLAKAYPPGNQISAAIYYMQSAALPASTGTYNVTVTSSGTNSFVLTANVVEFINVEQASGALDAFGGESTNSSCTTHSPSDTVSVGTAGDFIYGIAGVYGSATGMTNLLASGQTLTAQSTVSSLGTVAGYLKSTTTGTKTFAWTIDACSSSAQSLMSIKPALTP